MLSFWYRSCIYIISFLPGHMIMAAGQETIQQTQLNDEASLRHRVSGTRSPEPVVEKSVGLCFHVIRETMSSREKNGPEPFS